MTTPKTTPCDLEPQVITLSKLKSILDPSVKNSLSMIVRGMILTGLNIPNFDIKKSRYGDKIYFTVNQSESEYGRNKNFTASIILPYPIYKQLPDCSIIATGKKIDVQIGSLMLGNNTNIIVVADQVRENGISDYEMANREIKAKCEMFGWFKRIKRPPPAFFTRIGLITSRSGGVGSDILNILHNHGIPAENITEVKCGSTSEMSEQFRQMDSCGQFDAICFFRGGHEDPSMALFRDLELFKAIVEAKTFTATGLNHEQDHPVIESIVDMACNTPTAFGKMVEDHNNAVIESTQKYADLISNYYSTVAAKVHKDLHACKTLADTYYTTEIKMIMESISILPVEAFNGILRAMGAYTTSEYNSATKLYFQLSGNISKDIEFTVGEFNRLYGLAVSNLEQDTYSNEQRKAVLHILQTAYLTI